MKQRIIGALLATGLYLIIANVGNFFLASADVLIGQQHYGKQLSSLYSYFSY